MVENKKKGRLRIELSARQKVLLGILLVVMLIGLGYGWYYWKRSADEKAAPKAGINMALPGAKLEKKDPVDKMAYYELAKRDSARLAKNEVTSEVRGFGLSRTEDEQTRKINEKLASINEAISSPAPAVSGSGVSPKFNAGAGTVPIGKDVDRLEKLMKSMSSAKEADPEIEQLGTMMDKLLALQNPGLAEQLLKDKSTGVGNGDGVIAGNRVDSQFKAVPAVVSVNQRLRQGSVVELRLVDSMVVSGQVIPAGHLVYGLANFSNQRLNLEIKNIRLGTSIIPVKLTVFDRRDGMVGINAPDALVHDAVAGGVSSASGGIGVVGFDLGTQLAGAGLDAARSLLNKKVSRISQRLRAGYPLLLRDNTVKR
ncbi:conjugative transposon protein TraM [Pedobacter aquatilis]|uniref:conjugative transposon protein TraM n=1 Tax=Pedobacter aquatilis TaxID=351343 RepID=UPI002931B160|nr:conjugative transposon protein TraM [Pedobacter aquatilis]